MSTLAFSPNPRPDRTFSIALALVAFLGAAELVGVAFYYAGRARASREPARASVTAAPAASPGVSVPVVAQNSSATSGAPAGVASPAARSPEVRSVAERLLKEAAALRERGDTTNALARLQEAAQRDPKNASVLAETASIYESMQLFDRSNETWRKVQEIGPSAGALYELADMKLKLGVPVAPTAGPGIAGVSPLDAGTTRVDPDGIPDGSSFGITEVTPTPTEDPDAETNLTLRIGVKLRPNTVIDYTKVKIQVFFYDTLDNNKVALTDADVSYEWVTPHHDWKDTNPEILSVTYIRPKNRSLTSEAELSAAAAAVNPSATGKKSRSPKKSDAENDGLSGDRAKRSYLGYIVRVYYNDQLQAVRADPNKLLNLFPPPFTAAPQ
ncbi:MAG: hypothetical protein ABI871_03065 [Chthoniobacterales bacterium]